MSQPLTPELDAALERLAWALCRLLAERYQRTGTVAPGAPPKREPRAA